MHILKNKKNIYKKSKPKNYSALEIKTKKIYVKQHKNFSKDKSIFNRFLKIASNSRTYGISREFFVGKSVLDAGCGNTGYLQVAMKSLKASRVTCLDIGTDWIPKLKKVLKKYNFSKDSFEYVSATTIKIPFANESFDFVVSNGVLMHLASQDDAILAVKELSRVTKKGGYLYIYSGIESPGIVDRYIVPSLRQAYMEDKIFKKFIDNINHKKISSELKKIFVKARTFDKSISKSFIETIKNLFTLDSQTFTQNMLQVPIQQGNKLGYDWLKTQLKSSGLKNIRRIKEQYWVRNDYRKYIAPLHYFKKTGVAKLFYGGGHVKVIAKK
jgi:SAM-dependent methyltransferase